MGLRGKSCHCPPQLGHRVIELPALLARGTPAFSPESELAIAAGYGCPKSESLKRLSWASVWKVVVCLLGPDTHPVVGWEQVNCCHVKSRDTA